MTILLISHTSELNGAERSLVDLALGLKINDIDCTVLCPDNGDLSAMLQKAEISVYIRALPRPQRSLFNLIKFILLWIPTVLRLALFLSHKNIQVVYNNTIDGLYGPFSAKLAGVPCVWHVREVKPNNISVRKFFTWLLIHLPTITVFNSKATMRAYSCQVFPHWNVIYNGVQIKNNQPTFIRNKVAVTVGFAGQMTKHKRPDRFVDALAIAKKSCPTIEGVMAGDGILLEELKLHIITRCLTDSIQILGRVAEMPTFYRDIDIFVLTSDKEPFGRVLIEAMSFGCPVIAANVGGVSEVVLDEKTGFLVPSDDVNAYAEKIVLLATNRDLRVGMGLASYKRTQDKFSIAQCHKHLISILGLASKQKNKK